MGLVISELTRAERKSAYQVFEMAIPDAYENEGLGLFKDDIRREIEHKQHLIDLMLDVPDSNIKFLIAKLDQIVVGTISFGPGSEAIKKGADDLLKNVGELGSLYILPSFQGQGVGSALINAMLEQLYNQGIEQFCLDSGYKRAQKRWLRKFGEPYKVVKDYWGPGYENMIWLCKVSNFVKRV